MRKKIMMTIEDMLTPLQEGLCEVVFNKVDGSERIMTCTLVGDYIPDDQKPKGASTKPKSTETLAVFDINAVGWRSFRLENVTNFKTI
jgi:hypothetical protein|tara:strand:- start:2042 stop:2305 length:264 start_codon:yes stop_codon:yes gene_type:complete